MLESPNHLDKTSPAGSESSDRGFAAYEIVPGDEKKGLVLLCDHARNTLPPGYGTLGLPEAQLERHIGYDIGVETVTRALADRLQVPAVLSCFSRLLIDPNRGHDDPTMIMRLSDGAIVPGNAYITEQERQHRKTCYYDAYHEAITRTLDASVIGGRTPAILSIHSFTAHWRGVARPWHAGVLWDRDGRFPRPLIERLEAEGDLIVGSNEPYSGELEGDTLSRHGTGRGFAHALLEIRQDLIADNDGALEWADRLARVLPPILEDQTLYQPNNRLDTH